MSENIKINGHQENGSVEIPLAKLKEHNITDYIRESLEKVAIAEGFKNYSLNFDHGSDIGDGFVGVILKVTIKEEESDKKLTVLAKIPPLNPATRAAMKSMDLFEQEVFLYNSILPEFEKLQKDKNISKSQGFFNFPKVYLADFNLEKDDSIIIMEDLRESGHQMWNKVIPINYEHTKMLMITLGRLHALSFALKLKKPEVYEDYKQISKKFNDKMAEMRMEQFLMQSLQQAIETLDPEDTKRRQKVAKMMETLEEFIDESEKPESSEPFSVVVHGDCWINNYLYHYKKKGFPDQIVLIDWQVARCCSPAMDLMYFFFICTDHILRAKHFDELLNIYHNSLKDLLEKLGGDIMTQFPFTALLRQLKKFGKFGVIMAAFIVPMLQTKNEDLVDFDYVMEKMNDANQEVMNDVMKQFNEPEFLQSREERAHFPATNQYLRAKSFGLVTFNHNFSYAEKFIE